MPSDTDSNLVFGSITNYPLLREIVFTPCDERIFDLAVDNAILTGGLQRFFHDADVSYQAHPELLTAPRHQKLCRRARQRQAIIGSMYADTKDLPAEVAAAAFAKCAADLRAGMPFGQAATKCQEVYLNASDRDSSLIGSDNGDGLLERPSLPGYHHDDSVRDDRARRLLNSRTGETEIVRGKEVTRFYWVRELYVPPPRFPSRT